MPDDLERVDDCPACRSSRHEEVLSQPDSLIPGHCLTLVRCGDCGLVFLNPRMTRQGIVRLEDSSEVYEMDALETEREVDARIDLLRSFASYAPDSGRLLDVGCNRGLLLLAARDIGWRPVGVELSPVAAEKARRATGVPVYADLAQVPRRSGFDLVVAWHVLEHTTDPISFLRQIRRLLARGGVLALQVPSFDFVEEFRRQGRLGSIVCAVHNMYFTETTLPDALRRAGLRLRTLINSDADLMLTAFAARPRWATLLPRAPVA